MVLVRWLHLMVAVTWVGGMLFRTPVICPGKRPSYVGWGAMAILVPTGTLLAIDRGVTWDNLLSTSYGIVLSLKITLVGCMVALSYLHDFVLGPRLVELAPVPSAEAELLQGRMRILSRTNVLLGILVLLCVAILTS